MRTLTEFLQELEVARFYGSVEFKYEDGRITVARKTESIKFDATHRNNRGASSVQKAF